MSGNNVLVKQLMAFGLSEKEARVYLALLELEVATVTKIAKTANINRSSAYVVIEALKRKGFVTVSGNQKVQTYATISPDMLLFEAQNKAKKAEDIKNEISIIVPELKALHKDTKQKPIVRIFEGRDGIVNALNDSLNCKEKLIRISTSMKNWLGANSAFFRLYFDEYIKRRVNLKIKMRSIHPNNEYAEIFKERWKSPKLADEVAFIPQKKFSFPAEMFIYDDKVGQIFTNGEGVAIVIESKELTESMKQIFDLAFEEAKRIQKINKLMSQYKESIQEYTSR